MKAIRLALLLGVASTLVGCNNNSGPHTITFTGNNCVMSYEMGGDPIIAPITVDHGGEANFVIYTQDSETYAVPEKLDVQGQAEVTYSPAGQISSQASLVLKNITSNITITANGRERTNICSVTYYSDGTTCQWDKDSNPGSLLKNETLVAHLNVAQGYTFTKENIYVVVGHEKLGADKYTFTNNSELTISGEFITGNIVLAAGYVLPDLDYYNVEFTMENATKELPDKELQGIPLEGYIIANEGYRVPTKDEIDIRKKREGVDHPLTDDQFYYETYINSDGRSTAYLFIYDILELLDAKTISIEGVAVQQVKVTFQVGEGHWQNPMKTTEDRDGIIDKGKTLGDALKNASGGEMPIIDTEGWQFDVWKDDNGNSYQPGDPVNNNLKVHATFKEKECSIYSHISEKITVSPELPKQVKYNKPIETVTLTPNIAGYKLPEKSEIEVTMRHIVEMEDVWIPLDDNDFTYTLNAEHTSAAFSIKENVIKGDISITITPIQYLSVTFNPNGGAWPDKTDIKVTVSVPEGSTYQQAFNKIGKGGKPTRSGKACKGWKYGTLIIDMNQEISADGIELKAVYEEASKNFSEDLWENVIQHANAGDLSEYYGPTLFLGATRTLNYTDSVTKESKTYTVRVIDSNYDGYYKDASHEETVATALTFEFVDLVGEGSYNHASQYMGSNNWETSEYRTWLNNFYTEICQQNAGFEAKHAIKYTLQGRGAAPKDMIITEEYFFPMSGAEIGIAAENKLESGKVDTEYPDQQRMNEGVSEGLAYYYYQSNNSRVKKLNGVASQYWLRSPHVYKEGDPSYSDQSECYYIFEKGGSPTDYKGVEGSSTGDYSRGYMAAFCI